MKKYFKRSYGDRGFVIVTCEDNVRKNAVVGCEYEVIVLCNKSDLDKTHYVGACIYPSMNNLIPMTYEEVMLEIL